MCLRVVVCDRVWLVVENVWGPVGTEELVYMWVGVGGRGHSSVILLIICLVMILNYEAFGFENEALPTRLSFVLTDLNKILLKETKSNY